MYSIVQLLTSLTWAQACFIRREEEDKKIVAYTVLLLLCFSIPLCFFSISAISNSASPYIIHVCAIRSSHMVQICFYNAAWLCIGKQRRNHITSDTPCNCFFFSFSSSSILTFFSFSLAPYPSWLETFKMMENTSGGAYRGIDIEFRARVTRKHVRSNEFRRFQISRWTNRRWR